MRVAELDLKGLERQLRRGMTLEVGALRVAIRSNARGFAPTFGRLYAHSRFSPRPDNGLIDFPLALRRRHGLRRLVAPQVTLYSDQQHPFHPFPEDHAFPFFEWGMNWYLATQAHQYLLLHAAVVEKAGRALIMPARPGSGKSTLCAALIHRGWRLLSDEFGLVAGEGAQLLALPRPTALKNESIDILGRFAPEAVIGPVFPRTRKGAVAHVMPPAQSTERAHEPARPGWVVFPQYTAGVTTRLHPFPKGRAFLKLSGNAFNYKLKGPSGFRAVARIIHASHTYFLEFDSLEHAVERLGRMVDETAPENG
jgi:HprK-related kinase A